MPSHSSCCYSAPTGGCFFCVTHDRALGALAGGLGSPAIRWGKRWGKNPSKHKGLQTEICKPLILLVGTAGFELATPCTPCKCATRLRYAPIPDTLRLPACLPWATPPVSESRDSSINILSQMRAGTIQRPRRLYGAQSFPRSAAATAAGKPMGKQADKQGLAAICRAAPRSMSGTRCSCFQWK